MQLLPSWGRYPSPGTTCRIGRQASGARRVCPRKAQIVELIPAPSNAQAVGLICDFALTVLPFPLVGCATAETAIYFYKHNEELKPSLPARSEEFHDTSRWSSISPYRRYTGHVGDRARRRRSGIACDGR